MKTRFSFIATSIAVCFLTLLSTTAQEKSVKPGINKPFENPDLKDFLQKFEGESREIAAKAKEIIAACKLKPGMTVADVGAGTGLFTRKFAAEVGEKGKVFAVDIAPTFLAHIKKTCEESKIENVETILCDQFSTKLPKNSVDLVFICDTYHHFEFPQRTLQSIHDALRPGGQVILIDFRRIEGKSREWVIGHVRAGQEVFVREIKSAGFKVVGKENIFKENYFVRFEKINEKAQQEKTPTIAFSQDEKIISVHYEKGEWAFHRPVIASWDFKASGKVLWVAMTGNDANDGSTDKPFRTISKAVEAVNPGDVIYVRAGNYVESVLINKSGQEGKPIILSCAPGDLGKVKITPPKEYVKKNPSGAVMRVHSAQHVWINGFVIEGPMGRPEAPETEMYGANGITFAGKAGLGCRVTNCVIYWNVHCGIKEMGHGGTKILLEANVIFDNGTRSTDHGIYCPADDLTISGNIIFNNAGFGIHSYSSPKRQVITRNICMGNKAAGIILAGSDNKVFHNVCVNNGLGIMYFRGGCIGNIVKNNIFAFNRTDCGYDNGGGKYGDPAKNMDDFNCYFPGKPNERIKPGPNDVLADPLFVDSNKGDFRLRTNSPCLGKGLPFNGKTPDLGAFDK